MSREPADLGNQALRNAELRRLFVKPTVRLSDAEHPGVFDVYVLDERSREERHMGAIPGEALATAARPASRRRRAWRGGARHPLLRGRAHGGPRLNP